MPEKAHSDEGLTAEARPATKEDAPVLAKLVNMAGDGLPLYLWSKMAEDGEDPWEVGRRRAPREEGSFSYRNAVVLEHGKVIACLIGYPIVPSLPDPDTPAMFVPFNMLEALAVGSWYVNVMATLPEARARGYGSRLLAMADTIAEATGCTGTSLIVSDANTTARHLYESVGYRAIASEPMVKDGWTGAGENWVLMVKP